MVAFVGRIFGGATRVAGDDAARLARQRADELGGGSLIKTPVRGTVDDVDFNTSRSLLSRSGGDDAAKLAAKKADEAAKAAEEAAELAAKKAKEAEEAAELAAKKAKEARREANNLDALSDDQVAIKAANQKADDLEKAAREADEAAVEAAQKADDLAKEAKDARKAADAAADELPAGPAAQATDDVPGPRSGGKKLTPEKIEEAKVEFKEMGFNDAQVEKIMNSGIDLEELKKMHKMGMPIVPKTLWQEMTSTANIVNMVGAGGATYLATKWAEGGDQEEAAANSSESSYKGADPLGYNPYYGI